MLEVLFKGKVTVKQELPIQFAERWSGVSKNNLSEKIKQAKHIIGLLAYKLRRYISFSLIGGLGAITHFGILYSLTEYRHFWYMLSAIIAITVAATKNYILNHYITFKKQGNRNLAQGWGKYMAMTATLDGFYLLMLYGLTSRIGLWYMASAVVASGIAGVVKFMIAKNWIWKPKEETKVKKSEMADYEWRSFFKGMIFQKWWKQKIAKAVRDLAYPSGGEVLDIGCGSSPAGLLTEHSDYIGLDRNFAKIEFMRKKILAGAKFDIGSVNALPYEDNSFDTTLFIETIEHLETWENVHKALEEIRRVTRPHGRVIIATPNFGSLVGRIQDKLYGAFQKGAYADEHNVKFDLDLLEEVCAQHCLELEDSIIPLNADMVCSFTKREKG